MPACGSPWLFAAYHVLLRQSVPGHPPCALSCLIFSYPAWNAFHAGRIMHSDVCRTRPNHYTGYSQRFTLALSFSVQFSRCVLGCPATSSRRSYGPAEPLRGCPRALVGLAPSLEYEVSFDPSKRYSELFEDFDSCLFYLFNRFRLPASSGYRPRI